MQLRIMYDSVNMDAIPLSAEVVAGYPHRVPTTWDPGRFPHALAMAIDQSPDGDHADDCHAIDFEKGAEFNPATLRQWVQSWHQLHPQGLAAQGGWFARPVVYSDLVNLPAAQRALQGLAWDLWLASWPGPGPVLPGGTVAHQYAGTATSGGDYDLSVVSALFGARPVVPQGDPGQAAALAAAQLVVAFLSRPDVT